MIILIDTKNYFNIYILLKLINRLVYFFWTPDQKKRQNQQVVWLMRGKERWEVGEDVWGRREDYTLFFLSAKFVI